jgi:hypothetical protein
LAIWRGDEYILNFLFAISGPGLDFYYSALVVIFNISNSIRLRFRAGRFSNATTSPSRIRYQQPGQSTLKVKPNMKHVFLILLTIVLVLTGIFLPYIHGDYDYFAAGLFYICQFAAFASLLLIPVGLICLMMNFVNRRKNNQTASYPIYLRQIAFVVIVITVLAASLGAFASNNRFAAIIILCAGIYFLFANRKKVMSLFSRHVTSLLFHFYPVDSGIHPLGFS